MPQTLLLQCSNSTLMVNGRQSHFLQEAQTSRNKVQQFWQRALGSVPRDKTFPILSWRTHIPITSLSHLPSKPVQINTYQDDLWHLDYISQFTTDLRHIRGVDNSVANTLSRIEVNALTQEIPPVFEFIVMAKAQQTNPELKTLLANPQAPTPQIIPCQLYTSDLTILCDTSTRLPRPFVSKSLQKPVSDALHSLSHPGVCATQHSFCLATNQPRCEPVG